MGLLQRFQAVLSFAPGPAPDFADGVDDSKRRPVISGVQHYSMSRQPVRASGDIDELDEDCAMAKYVLKQGSAVMLAVIVSFCLFLWIITPYSVNAPTTSVGTLDDGVIFHTTVNDVVPRPANPVLVERVDRLSHAVHKKLGGMTKRVDMDDLGKYLIDRFFEFVKDGDAAHTTLEQMDVVCNKAEHRIHHCVFHFAIRVFARYNLSLPITTELVIQLTEAYMDNHSILLAQKE